MNSQFVGYDQLTRKVFLTNNSRDSLRMQDYTEIGGAKVGRNWWLGIYGTWPFGKITIVRDGLQVRLLCMVYRFNRSEILRLEVRRLLLGACALRIHHSVLRYPRLVEFWSYRWGTLRQALEERAYAIC